jgi:hypothetical protein
MSINRLRCLCASYALQTGLRGFFEGVLPDADDFPALVAELAGDAFIASHVVFALVDALAAGK